jgi:hypothetical protein
MSTTLSAAQPGLVRVLGPILATALVVGTVIGSGVFKKPQVVAENVPYFGLAALAWVLGGVLVLLGALSLAEVAILYPAATMSSSAKAMVGWPGSSGVGSSSGSFAAPPSPPWPPSSVNRCTTSSATRRSSRRPASASATARLVSGRSSG